MQLLVCSSLTSNKTASSAASYLQYRNEDGKPYFISSRTFKENQYITSGMSSITRSLFRDSNNRCFFCLDIVTRDASLKKKVKVRKIYKMQSPLVCPGRVKQPVIFADTLAEFGMKRTSTKNVKSCISLETKSLCRYLWV